MKSSGACQPTLSQRPCSPGDYRLPPVSQLSVACEVSLGVSDRAVSRCRWLCRRGKHNQKQYTVYIASVTAEEQAAFTPQLNHEHSEYKWWDVAALVNSDTQPALHPVVDLLLQVLPLPTVGVC